MWRAPDFSPLFHPKFAQYDVYYKITFITRLQIYAKLIFVKICSAREIGRIKIYKDVKK